MLQESLYSWTATAAQPGYSLDGGDDVLASLVYDPISALWAADQNQHEKPTAAHQEVCLGPGVQLDGPEERGIETGHKEMAQGVGVEPSISARSSVTASDDIFDHVTNMDIDMMARYKKEALVDDSVVVDRCPMEHDIYDDLHVDLADADHDFCSFVFKSIPEPLLPRLSSPPTRAGSTRARRLQRTMVATRSSLWQVARASLVLVAQRTQQKLMCELDFINPHTPAPDAAVTAYIRGYVCWRPS
jgi:hypothetical protein